ncbi:hypothetical protein KR044_004133, partial [Drosophila immigrans]
LINIANRIESDSENDLQDLKRLINNCFPESTVKLHLFGSRYLGLGQESSDFDVYVEIGKVYTLLNKYIIDVCMCVFTNLILAKFLSDNCFNELTTKNSLKVHQRLMRIKNAIASDSNWTLIEWRGGRCPIVRIINIPINSQFDINCCNGLTCSQNKLVKYIFKLQPMARYMVVYLRVWLKNHNLFDKFRSHVIVLMVIFYLQVSNFLPGIKKFQEYQLPTCGPWVVTFNELKLTSFKMSQIMVDETETRNMLTKFFEYYSKFAFSNEAICPYLGYIVSTSSLSTRMPMR